MDGVRLFIMIPSDRTKGNGQKMEHKKLHMNMRKKLHYFEGARALEQCCTEKLISLSRDIQHLLGCFPVQFTVGNLL